MDFFVLFCFCYFVFNFNFHHDFLDSLDGLGFLPPSSAHLYPFLSWATHPPMCPVSSSHPWFSVSVHSPSCPLHSLLPPSASHHLQFPQFPQLPLCSRFPQMETSWRQGTPPLPCCPSPTSTSHPLPSKSKMKILIMHFTDEGGCGERAAPAATAGLVSPHLS